MIRRVCIVLAVLVAAACAAPAAVAPPVPMAAPLPPPPPPIEQQVAALKTRLFILVEERRQQSHSDAKPLAFDAELDGAAQAHADAMAKAKTFDPDNGDNRAIETLLDDPDFRGYVGENSAAQFYTASVGMDPEKYAEGFLDIWLSSEQHKSNILFPAFDKTGIGIAVTGDEVFVALLLATDLGLPKPSNGTLK
jgi:uncharacterized protein YkwD